MVGWLIETYCGLTGHLWDRSHISTDICTSCGKIRFVSPEEETARLAKAYQPFIDTIVQTIKRWEGANDNPRCFCPDCGADLGRFYSNRIRMERP